MNKNKQRSGVFLWCVVISCVYLLACTEQSPTGKGHATKPIEFLPDQTSRQNISNRTLHENEFVKTLYPLLSANCASCHALAAVTPALPFFADPDTVTAFNQVYKTGNIDLLQPENSRIVVKLRSELHSCWTTDCAADATVLQTAIEEWASLVNIGQDAYDQLCSTCHGVDGTGTTATTGLTRPMALADLINAIETTMPPADPASCVGTCASDIANYVFTTFNESGKGLINDPLANLPEGQEQLALLCTQLAADAINNVVRDVFCNGPAPKIQSLKDLQAALGLAFTNPNATGRRNNGRRGNPAFALTGHSSSLVARFVSAINPRAIIFTPPVRVNGNRAPNPGFVAMGFVRGDQFAEIVASDPVTNELTFFLITFKQACNLTDTCTPGDLLTPAVESNWIDYTVYSQTDLQNTILDCLQCHQTGGPGTASILRMQELRNPWTHFFRNNRRGGIALLNDFIAAHGVNEDYAGIPAQLISASDPENLEDLVRGNGFRQPNEFPSRRIENQVNNTPGQPANNDIPGISATWQRIYNASVRGEFIPVPYHDVKVTDSAKLEAMTAAYQAFLNGSLAAAELPDIRDVFLDSMLPDIGFRVMAGLDGQQIITQACTQCHNSNLNQSITRARFNVDLNSMSDNQGGILTGDARDNEISLAISRLNMAKEDVRKMPPEQFKTLDEAEIQAATSYLCSQMTLQSAQCTNVPVFVASPATLPPADSGRQTGGNFPRPD